MTRRSSAASTASPSGSRSSASGRGRAEPRATTTAKAKSKAKTTPRRAPRGSASAGDGVAPAVSGEAPVAPPRRSRAKRGQGDQLREQILDATHDLLVETGDADKVSTRAVARRVGCSSPALYLHFPDRAALLWAVCNRQFVRLGELVASAARSTDDPIAALRAMGRAYITFGVEHTEEYRVMMMAPEAVVWNPPMADLPNEAGFDILLDVISRAMAEGHLREGDPIMTALTIWSGVHGLVALRVAKPSFDWPPIGDQIDHLLDVMLWGIGVDPRSSG